MTEPNLQETRELMLGTWIAVALIVESLIDGGAIPREELLCLLAKAEELAQNRRRTAIAGVRLLIERGFG